MFKLTVMKSCPWTHGAGVVKLEPALIALLAGAVYETDEWAIVLTGKRSSDGYEVEVEDYFIPPQERMGQHVSVGEIDLTPEVVGVIHSHHHMGAFWSPTDKEELNTRFPISIVVAQNPDKFLGFEYKAEGRVKLPCGSLGVVEFNIQPTVGPLMAEVVRKSEFDPEKGSRGLGDCARYTVDQDEDYMRTLTAKCGLVTNPHMATAAYGVRNDLLELIKLIPAKKEVQVYDGRFDRLWHGGSLQEDKPAASLWDTFKNENWARCYECATWIDKKGERYHVDSSGDIYCSDCTREGAVVEGVW